MKSVPFLHEPARVELVPGAAEALSRLQSLGLRLAIVTNQQGIGLGYFTTDDFIAVNQAMLKQLAAHGVRISKIYYCPHSLADDCPCRKPGTRLLERALRDFCFAPGRAFVVGDTTADSGAAHALGVASLQVLEHDSSSWDAVASAIEAVVARWRATRLTTGRPRSLDNWVDAIRQTRFNGIEGFPDLPGHDDLRLDEVARMGSGRGAEPPVHPSCTRGWHQFLRHRRYVLGGRERGSAGPGAAGLWPVATRWWWRRRYSSRWATTQTSAGCLASTSMHAIDDSLNGSAPTTSTSTRSIASTTIRRSRKRSRPCTMSSARAKRCTSAHPPCRPGNLRRCSTWPSNRA